MLFTDWPGGEMHDCGVSDHIIIPMSEMETALAEGKDALSICSLLI